MFRQHAEQHTIIPDLFAHIKELKKLPAPASNYPLP